MCWKIISIRDMVPSLTIRQLKSRIEIHNFPPNQNRWRRLFVWVAGFIRWPWTEFVVLVFVAFAWVLVSLATLANVWRLVVLFRYFIVFACQIREELWASWDRNEIVKGPKWENYAFFILWTIHIDRQGFRVHNVYKKGAERSRTFKSHLFRRVEANEKACAALDFFISSSSKQAWQLTHTRSQNLFLARTHIRRRGR